MDLARSLLAWALALSWVVWALMRTLGLERGYPLVPLAAFTPYAALAAVAAVAVALLLRRHAAALLAAAAALALVWGVAPRVLADERTSAASGPRLRVLSANVLFGRVRPETLVALVRRERVDVLSVQELTPAMARGLEAAGLHDTLPERVLRPRSRAAGSGIYARVPLRPRPEPVPSQAAIAVARAERAGPRSTWWRCTRRRRHGGGSTSGGATCAPCRPRRGAGPSRSWRATSTPRWTTPSSAG